MNWISAEDELPKEHQIVDAWTDEGERVTDVEFYDGQFWSAEQQFDVDDCGYGCFQNTNLLEGVLFWICIPPSPTGN